MDIITIVDYVKFFVAFGAAIIFLVAFAAPLFGTIIPYWKEHGRPSGIMFGRVGTRFFLFILALHEAVFPLNSLLGEPVSPTPLVVVVIPVLIILSASFMYSWCNHPDGIRGL